MPSSDAGVLHVAVSTLRNTVKQHSFLKSAYLFGKRFTDPVSLKTMPAMIKEFPRFFRDLKRFRKCGGVAKTIDLYPCLFDRASKTTIDVHYFNQAVWAFRRIAKNRAQFHVDIGSQVMLVGMISTLMPTVFVDIRPLKLQIENYLGVDASILKLPFANNSIQSLSCLHVIEHIGLGRYGDPIDPFGTTKAAAEIVRVVGLGGSAYVSTTIGRSRVQFNGQRVFEVQEIVRLFSGMVLREFSAIKCDGAFIDPADPHLFDVEEAGSGADCGLGIFHFIKPAGK